MNAGVDCLALCLSFLRAESEKSVQQILESNDLFASAVNWRPIDRRETNFNVTSNQASDGGKALTELMTNMVDAVLLKHSRQKGIEPTGKEAPTTMYEAVDRLIKNLRGGKLVNLDPTDPWLRQFAQENLLIGVTGAKSAKLGLPCYTFVDNGEGQSPQDFESTFLSLSSGNKKDIRFVQGKYNMGSSGVLGYCGRRWFKLIVSRRFDGRSDWGFTLVRRRPGEGMPVAEYFVLPDGSIPSFEASNIRPFVKSDGDLYAGIEIFSGTIVKLFDYQIGSKFASGFRGAREALNENLVETILPFRLLDFRQKPSTTRKGERAEGIDPRPFYGMEFLLLRSHREGAGMEEEDEAASDGERIEVGTIQDPQLGIVQISAIPLKRNLPGWLEKSNNRVFHHVNGQVQYKQTRGYLSQSCGLPALKDRAVIFVDASRLSFGAHNDVWKGDREHMRNTVVGEQYAELVTEAIRQSDALKNLQAKVAREELSQAAKSQRDDLFQKLVDADRNLAALLGDRDPVIYLPGSEGEDSTSKQKDIFEGRRSPTFVMVGGKAKSAALEVPINKTRALSASTDAENNYLQRADNTGSLLLDPEIKRRFQVRFHLHDGNLTLHLRPIKEEVNVGESYEVRIGLQDDSMSLPVEDYFVLTVSAEDNSATTQRRKNSGKDDKEETRPARRPSLGLPKYRLLTRDGRRISDQDTEKWPAGFGEYDGGTVVDLSETEAIYKINYDNVYHLKYRQQQRGDVARDVVTEKYILGMRISMIGFERAFRSMRQQEAEASDTADFADEFRRMASRAASSTVLALAENLPKIVDKGAVAEDSE